MTRDRCERCLETSQAEAEGNRTPQAEILGFNGFEDRTAHQDGYASSANDGSLIAAQGQQAP
jgi:hypothetical protein